MTKPTDPPTDGPPCPGCRGPHDLRACADIRGAAVLRERGRLSGDMAAYARAAPRREREADPDRPGLFDAIGGAR